ncbi:unnamed protein product [Cladocopium goreaui]|uniref:C3H1-type domain-containing protein n=1 Tax=Cladocopium goreaui TaxID=2562237 RepID=A0A9P1GKY6_9DINO|nr:unnamed protein product [Cladocopium goreaui]
MPAPPGPTAMAMASEAEGNAGNVKDRPDVLSGSTTDDENLDSEDAASAAEDAEGSVSDAEGQEQGAASQSESDQQCSYRSPSRSAALRSRSRRPLRRRQLCWFGRSCKRRDCHFLHPEGKESQAPQTPRRRRFEKPGHRRRSWRRNAKGEPWQHDQRGREGSEAATPPKHRKRSEVAISDDTKPPTEPLNFRDFVVQMPEGTPPDVALEAFQKYLREASQKDLEKVKDTGFFFDRYDPVARLRAYDLRLHEARLNASVFVTDLCEGRFDGLNLSTTERPNMEGRCSVSGHLQAPEFAFDPDMGALLIEDLPKHLSAWEVYESLQDCGGFCTASWSSTLAPRSFHARFRSSREARQAMEALGKLQLLREDGSCAVAQLCGLTPLSAFVLPPEMSLPERLQRDLELSAEVLRRLDALLEVCHEATEYILQYPGSTELKLDLQVLYLRRVHHFCFYAASWCQDEWALRDRCGAVALRGKRPSILERSDSWYRFGYF